MELGYDIRNIVGYELMSEAEKDFFRGYGYSIEQQANLIAQQHGLESKEHEQELSKLLRDLEAKREEYVVEGALLKCPLGTYEKQILIEQNRCAMACQGCGAVFLFRQLKSSGNQVLIVVLLSHDTKQSTGIDISTAYDKNNTLPLD